MNKPIFAAFDQGATPTITVANMSKTPLGVDFKKLVAALQVYADKYFVPVWGTPCHLEISKDGKIPKGNWGFVFLDDADEPDALGYHDLTADGFPLSKIFVKTTIDNGDKVSVTASHELAEMLVDPGIQLGAMDPKGVWYAYETADAVETEEFDVNGIAMSNFVYPAWFEPFHKPNSTKFDYLGTCKKPFELRPGGYIPVFKKGKWSQIFGAKKTEKSFNQAHHFRTGRRVKSKGLVPVKCKLSKPRTGC
jgi:hypothetical protein